MTNFAHTCTECGEVYKWRGVDVCGSCFKAIKAERDQLREQIAQCNEIVNHFEELPHMRRQAS